MAHDILKWKRKHIFCFLTSQGCDFIQIRQMPTQRDCVMYPRQTLINKKKIENNRNTNCAVYSILHVTFIIVHIVAFVKLIVIYK